MSTLTDLIAIRDGLKAGNVQQALAALEMMIEERLEQVQRELLGNDTPLFRKED